jgi:hypothetical protein
VYIGFQSGFEYLQKSISSNQAKKTPGEKQKISFNNHGIDKWWYRMVFIVIV